MRSLLGVCEAAIALIIGGKVMPGHFVQHLVEYYVLWDYIHSGALRGTLALQGVSFGTTQGLVDSTPTCELIV